MLTFNDGHPGVPGPPILRLLVIFFRFFSIRLTNPISGNAFNAKLNKKKGDDLSLLINLLFGKISKVS